MSEILFKPLYQSGLERTPILEYDRVADCLLSGIVEGLIAEGYTEEMAKCFLSSKILRCELDGKLEDGLADFGRFYARTIASAYFSTCEQYAKEN